MGNCWGSKEEPNVQLTNSTPPEVKNSQAPAPAPPLTRFVAPNDEVVAKASEGGRRETRPMTPIPTPTPRPVTTGKITRPELKVFVYTELKSATRNFRPDSVVGEGGFGRVYKGWIDETTLAPSRAGVGIPVAVKRCNPDSSQGLKEWKTEIDLLGKFSHSNLVRLIGYCWEDRELLLVYEYMPKGSLENHLFQRNVEPPSWSTRIRIAMDAARGLDFLHTSKSTVIYRDFKAANILLDENYGAKLSDFGFARQGPPIDKSHVTTQAVGTYGYAAPEYLNTGHLYIKSDVYGFGVVLLEILTGKRAYDINRAAGQTSLADWYKPMLNNKSKTKKIIDPRMGDYPSEGVYKLAQLILACLENDPKRRPPMDEVLSLLESISTITMGPKRSRPKSSKSQAHGLQKKPTKAHSYHPSPLYHQNGSSTTPQPRRHTHG